MTDKEFIQKALERMSAAVRSVALYAQGDRTIQADVLEKEVHAACEAFTSDEMVQTIKRNIHEPWINGFQELLGSVQAARQAFEATKQ